MSELPARHSLLAPFRQDPAMARARHTASRAAASAAHGLAKAVAAVGLLLGSPVFLRRVLNARREGEGSVLATRARIGLEGRTFSMYVFRGTDGSAATDHPEAPDRFKTLPQLINVVRGDMSLIGPRAPRPEELARTLRARPGLVQLSIGRRGSAGSALPTRRFDLRRRDATE